MTNARQAVLRGYGRLRDAEEEPGEEASPEATRGGYPRVNDAGLIRHARGVVVAVMGEPPG
jgi:hypothetical protein